MSGELSSEEDARRRRFDPPSERPDRGQTTIDFLIAISTFVIVVGFLFAFVPGTTLPFNDGQSANPLIADRAATHLVTDALADPAESSILAGERVVDFFDPDDDPNADLAIAGSKRVHVGITDSAGDPVTYSGTELRRGPKPPAESGRVTIAQRTVALDEEPCRLEMPEERCTLSVRVW